MKLVVVGECMVCGKESAITVDDETAERIVRWDAEGRPGFVQDAFPKLSADAREQLVSKTHGPCFDELFPNEEG